MAAHPVDPNLEIEDEDGYSSESDVDQEVVERDDFEPSDNESTTGSELTEDDQIEADDAVDIYDRYVTEVSSYENNIDNFNMMGYQTEFTVSEDLVELDGEEICNTLEKIVQVLINRAVHNASQNGYECVQMGLEFAVDGMDHVFTIPYRPPEQNNAAKLTEEMNKFIQSGKIVTLFDRNITVKVTVVNQPVGGGRKLEAPVHGLNINSAALVRVPPANDNLCLFKAVILAKYYADNRGDPHCNAGRGLKRLRNDSARLKRLADELRRECKIRERHDHYGIPECARIQARLHKHQPFKYNIVVFGKLYGHKPVFNGNINAKHVLTLFHHDNHFDAAQSPSRLLGVRNYCVSCQAAYSRINEHTYTCKFRCPKCLGMGHGYPQKCKNPNQNRHRKCHECDKWFETESCFEAHKVRACATEKHCRNCDSFYSTRKERVHVCGVKLCRSCWIRHPKDWDECKKNWVTPIKRLPKKNYRLVAYDFECTIDQPFGKRRFKHNVNAVSTTVTCKQCMDKGIWKDLENSKCKVCGPCKRLYWSVWDCDDPLQEFVEWLFRGNGEDLKSWCKYTTYAYAHNGAKYDAHFTLQEMFKRAGVDPKIVSSGNKVMQVKVAKSETTAEVCLRDSNLLFPMKLDAAPATFGFEKEVPPKPDFPYRLNTEANYFVPTLPNLPPKEDYIPERFSRKERERFDKWYAENYNTRFNLRETIKDYCQNDTLILLYALVTFRQIFNDIAGVQGGEDLFIVGLTITSLCMRLFRYRFLAENHIARVPEGGYGRHDRQSEIARKWLKFVAKEHNVEIQFCESPEGERVIDTYKVDGYITLDQLRSPNFKKCSTTLRREAAGNEVADTKYDCFLCRMQPTAGTDLILEHDGCAIHGCEDCHKNDYICVNGNTSDENLRETRKRRWNIECVSDAKFWTMHECAVLEELKKNESMRKFFDLTHDTGPLNPRDGFFGGRVAAARLVYDKPRSDEVIKYFDVVSLYPYVLMNREFPVGGKPVRIFKAPLATQWHSSKDLPFKGVYKVLIVAPDNLVIPVVPQTDDHRLVFSLCRQCTVESRRANPHREPGCHHHDDNQRAWVTTITHPELGEALDSGYRILKFIEGWKWPEEQWSNELFRGYLREFLRLKIEATGWKENGVDPADEEAKDRFVRECKEYEGLDVRRDHVDVNPGLRYIAKLCANSLWGRFALRPDKVQVRIVREPSELTELFQKPSIEVISIIELNKKTLRVAFRYKKRYEKEDRCANIVLAMFTTAYGRLELLKHMRRCEEGAGGPPGSKLLYHDTDSVTAVFKRDNIGLQVGQYVGQMKDEYPGYEIEEFLSGGSKNYGLKMRNLENGQMVHKQKVRGITFNHVTAEILSYERQKMSIKSLPNVVETSVPNHLILRDAKSNVYTHESTKIYRPYVRKAWIDGSYEKRNWPYGYRRPTESMQWEVSCKQQSISPPPSKKRKKL